MNNMAYENNNVRAGANGAGVYVGNTEIMGGTDITAVNLYNKADYNDVLIVNATDAVAYIRFYIDSDLDVTATCQPFTINCLNNISTIADKFEVQCGDNSYKYKINTCIRTVISQKDASNIAQDPAFTIVNQADEHFTGDSYWAYNWDYANSENAKESFAGGWIVLTMDI